MKKGLQLIFCVLCLFVVPTVFLQAQSCEYKLDMFDSFGDGWNNATLTITVGGVANNYTFTTGTFATAQIPVTTGAAIQLDYVTGFYENEVSYTLYDSDNLPVFSAGPFPPSGINIYSTTAVCPTCPAVSPASINVSAITASTATVSWLSGGNPGSYIVEYGPSGFTLGSGIELTTAATTINLTGLNDYVGYDVYVTRNCGAVDGLSSTAGPASFVTTFAVTPPTCIIPLVYGDTDNFGWDGAFIDVEVPGTTSNFSLFWGALPATQNITAYQNYPISITYTGSAWNDGGNYWILGDSLMWDGPIPIPQAGTQTIYACPTCAGPQNVYADPASTSAKMQWSNSADAGTYKVEYGTVGFTIGTGTVVNANVAPALMTGLTENTYYDAYITLQCGAGNNSYRVGPITFKTAWTIDVGIADITNPTSECGLSAAELFQVAMKNFGGAPQSLIPFKYAVNSVEASIPQPLDGFYTGVISNDSVVSIDFETTYDFTTFGDYTITAYTQLEGDSDPSNDAKTVTITSIPEYNTFPKYETYDTWSGGWTTPDGDDLWEHGVPEASFINSAASGENVWATNLDGNYTPGIAASYVYSPCLDFSSLSQSPSINFSLNFQTQSGYDGFWLEGTKDGGTTWEVVASPTAVNWYNSTSFFTGQQFWSGTNLSGTWESAQCPLTGYNGFSDCRLRFVFHSEVFTFGANNGAAIDNVLITIPIQKDLAVTDANRLSTTECGDDQDQLVVKITNYGTQAQQGFNVYYTADGGALKTGLVTALVAPGANINYTFPASAGFNSTNGGHDILAWVALADDAFTPNDTLSKVVGGAEPISLPFVEDFEANGPTGTLPNGWVSSSGAFAVTNQHNNVSFVAYTNLYQFNPAWNVVSPNFGPINAGDSLSFDYRLTNFFAGDIAYNPGLFDILELQISTDCGDTYSTVYTVNQITHIPSTVMANRLIDLSAYAGQTIKARFIATWGEGDYWVDIDNINVVGCPANLGLITETDDASSPTAADGNATVTPNQGSAPYTYAWSNGSTASELTNVTVGTYTVTVVDNIGCVDELEVVVEWSVGIDALSAISKATLMPNPTTGATVLDLQINRATHVQVQVLNMVGQVVYQTQVSATGRTMMPIDSQLWPSGVYLVRISADHDQQTLKLVRQ